jgi:crossover junction endodeoxyribonuclease RuvC
MRVCGIDCGTETTGYGVVECDDRGLLPSQAPRLVSITSGGICPPKKAALPERLALIYAELIALFERCHPDVVAVEEVFYSVNAKSAIKLGHVRGVALLAAAIAGLPIAEYAPLTIKSTVTGYGLAAKQQVQFMVARLLSLPEAPQPADAADALAIAICHIHHAQTLALQEAHAV